MKPYGREKNIKGSGKWKKDYHIHFKNHKILNWWEDISKFLTRGRMKQIFNNEIKKEIDNKI